MTRHSKNLNENIKNFYTFNQLGFREFPLHPLLINQNLTRACYSLKLEKESKSRETQMRRVELE